MLGFLFFLSRTQIFRADTANNAAAEAMESHDPGREASGSGGAETTSRRDDEALLKDEDSFVMIDDDDEVEDEDMAPVQPNPVLKTPEDAVAYWNQSYEKVR